MTGPLRIERRLDTPWWLKAAVPLASVFLAAIIVAILLAATGHNPFSTYHQMYSTSVTADGALTATFVYATPLLFTGLCASFAFRMRTWNIGGEGQLYMGAVGASATGLALGDWPRPLLIIAMVVGGCLAGMVWACIPALLRAYLRTNEILTSLMLNYVGGFLMYYLIYDSNSYWRDLSPQAAVFPTGKTLVPNASWPGITIGSFTLPLGFVMGVGLAIGLLVLIRKTRYGFEMRVMGDSPQAANYSGIRTKRKIVSVMAISGGIAGIAGSSQIGDFGHVLDPRGLEQAQYGYTGIVVAALALYNPIAVVIVSLLIGGLTNAGFALEGPSFPTGLVGTMEGIILFTVLGGEILARYRIGLRRRSAQTVSVGPTATSGVAS